ncbi:hypothetical protein CNYM01_02135 [Colletotrichum nymphaeae SA-01]|uniref:Uncharacterized protein n=1 Tax=Colletotrichum nymphaeae SA-01 TaxID=1460502 RepID=A0A135TVY3_9PEZI|nr:hypothetical protein CNYM01_02135 [Colletotrichum nymphaeae SA-01]
MANQATSQSKSPSTTSITEKNPAGTGSPIATISAKFDAKQQQPPPVPRRPNHASRSSSTSSKRISAVVAPIEPSVKPSEDYSAAPGALRRSLSFKIPIRVATDNLSPANRSRAQSLPQEHQSDDPSHQRHNPKRGSLSSIGEKPTAEAPKEPQATSPTLSIKSLSEQFLKERGLLNSEPVDETSSPEELQHSLQDQVVRYLTTMSSPAKTPAEEQSRAPAYPTSYPPANTGMRGNMPAPGLPVPMPNLSGTANGPVGNLLRGPVDENGKLTKAALMVGIKLDLEAEVHLTARVRGDILVGLY